MSESDYGPRLSRVESEITGLKVQMQGFGDVLNRIESGISQAQQQANEDKAASRINPIALTTVLISIISILVGGSWLISGELSRHDERSSWQAHQIEQIEQRQWQSRGGDHGNASTEPHQ